MHHRIYVSRSRTEPRLNEDEWMEKEELPLETRCKMAGMKMMARWLLGLKVRKGAYTYDVHGGWGRGFPKRHAK